MVWYGTLDTCSKYGTHEFYHKGKWISRYRNSPVLLLVVGEVGTVDRMGDAGPSLQHLLPLVEFVLELGPLLLIVVLFAVDGGVATAAAAGVAAPLFRSNGTAFAAALLGTRLLAVAFATAILALVLRLG